MQKLRWLSVAVFLTLSIFASNAFAVGYGIFFDASGGSGEGEWDSDYDAWDIDSRTVAGGFVMDTSPTNRSVFNYRLNIGLAAQELEDDYGVTIESKGIYFENIFGFAIVRKPNFRLWVGPLVRIGLYSGETDEIYGNKVELDYAEVGLGAAMGLNFKAGKVVISPSFGVRVAGLGGEGESSYRDLYISASDTEDFEGHTTTAFANIALLF